MVQLRRPYAPARDMQIPEDCPLPNMSPIFTVQGSYAVDAIRVFRTSKQAVAALWNRPSGRNRKVSPEDEERLVIFQSC